MEGSILANILISWLPAVLILMVVFWLIRAVLSTGRTRSEMLALNQRQIQLLERIAVATEKLAAREAQGRGKNA